MSRIPRIAGPDLIRALAKLGFSEVRTRGSHHFLAHEDGRTTVVPAHSGETIGPGLLHKIHSRVQELPPAARCLSEHAVDAGHGHTRFVIVRHAPFRRDRL